MLELLQSVAEECVQGTTAAPTTQVRFLKPICASTARQGVAADGTDFLGRPDPYWSGGYGTFKDVIDASTMASKVKSSTSPIYIFLVWWTPNPKMCHISVGIAVPSYRTIFDASGWNKR
jgi:hypothetical protein